MSRLSESRVLIFLLTLAMANTVSIAGSQVEETEESSSSNFEAESGDELALVQVAAAYDVRLASRSQTQLVVSVAGADLRFDLLHTLAFDSARKRMSVVVREEESGLILLLCKGADCSVLPRAKASTDDLGDYQEAITRQILEYSSAGLRTLVMAARTVEPTDFSQWCETLSIAENSTEGKETLLKECYDMLEKDLDILGATAVEDKLQVGVPSALLSMRAAGLAIWLLTGDSQLTAESVATSCHLITPDTKVITINIENTLETMGSCLNHHLEQVCLGGDHALVIDGHNLHVALSTSVELFLKLAKQCSFVLACRVTPLQKGVLARLVGEKLGVLTMAIGDGANDVSMIQTANVGVAILGQEGRQAAMASDFAIPRFELVARLILVHGHWSYIRPAGLVLNSFCKNAVFVLTMFWFQL